MCQYVKLLLFVITFSCMPINMTSTSDTDEGNDISVDIREEESYDEIYDLLEIDKVSYDLKKSGLNVKVDMKDMLDLIINGDFNELGKLILKNIRVILVDELITNRALMIQLISIVLIGSIFVNLSGSFGNGFISDNGFYITYLIITSILLTSFTVSLELVSDSIEKILMFIRIIVPVYLVAMNFVGHAHTALGMYEVIMLIIWLVQTVIIRFILPMIKFYVIISLINNFNKEDSFSRLCKLIKSIVNWIMKTVIIFIVGLNIIKSLINPQIDALEKTTINKVISAVPGGGILSVLSSTFLGAGMIVKNGIGILGIIILLIVVLIPILKVFFIMLTVRLTSVVIQPIGEKRYVVGIEALAQGMSMLLQTLASSVVLFMLTIAIMTYAAGGG